MTCDLFQTHLSDIIHSITGVSDLLLSYLWKLAGCAASGFWN